MSWLAVSLLLAAADAAAPPASCSPAWQQHCYKQEPFYNCCLKNCITAEQDTTCEWSFRECDNCYLHGKFAIEGEACNTACAAFNNPTNRHFDYCDNGKVSNAAQNCENAKKSLKTSVPHDWCELASSQKTCHWKYSVCKMGSGSSYTCIEQNIEGHFTYSPDSSDCDRACKMLGSDHNAKETYCDPEFKKEMSQGCPQAQKSLSTNKLTWCGGGADLGAAPVPGRLGAFSVVLAREPNRSTALASPSSLYTTCETAFNDGCYKYMPFSGCCKGCGSSNSYLECHYSVDLPGGDQIEGSFKFTTNSKCMDGCNALRPTTGVILKTDVCGNGKVRKLLGECNGASLQSLTDAVCKKQPDGHRICPNDCPPLEAAMEAVGSESVSATTVAGCALSMMGLVALVVAVLRWRSPNAANQYDVLAAEPSS